MTPAPPRHILRRFPSLTEQVPWLPLGRFPTPVERLDGLKKTVTAQADIWVKRDDLSGDPLGSNKVRKLEILLGEAVKRGRKRILASGALGSNHVVACLTYARQLSLQSTCVLFPQPMWETPLRNLKVDLTLSDHVAAIPSVLLLPFAIWLAAWRDARRDGQFPHVIPMGGSSASSVLGFAEAGLELGHQIEDGFLPEPDAIVLPLGSCGTVAGLALGARLASLKSQVVAVRVVDRIVANRRRALGLANAGLNVLKRVAPSLALPCLDAADIQVEHGYFGRGYAYATFEGAMAVEIMRKTQGIELETTYTGKALACAIDLARSLPKGKPVLFWNTYAGRLPLAAEEIDSVAIPEGIQKLVDRCPDGKAMPLHPPG